MEQRLQTINEPLQKQLIEKGDTYARCLNSYIEYYSFKQDELRKTIQLQENSKENITLKIGGTKADLKNVNEHIKNQESIVSKVDKREKELRPLWQDFKSFQDGLLHYSHEYEDKLTFRDKLNADLDVCENDRTVLKNKETELKQDLASKDQILQNVETRLNDVSKRWSELTNIRLFKVLVDPELSGSITPDYQLLSEDKISEWRSTVSNLENDKFELQNKISSLKYDLEYYTKSKFFPPPREVNDLLQTLKFQNYAVQYGWEYLAQNFQNNVAFIEKWAQEYPYLLDGIVVIYPDLSEMKNIVNNLNIHFLESSIYFTSAKAFTSTFSSQLVNNESFVLGTALMWRYKFELLEDRAKKIESEVQTSSNKIVEIENTIIERNTFIEICMKFRTRCSEQEYQDLKNEQITRKNEIDLLKRELDELSDEENQLNIKLKSLRLNIKTTSTNIETLNKNIIALENFKQLFEERKETLTKIEDFRKKEQTFRNEQEKLEKDLGTINTAIENTRMQEKYYIDWLKDYNKIFPEITTTIKLSKKSTDIKPTLNIDDLAREYNTIKDILKNNKDLQTIYRQIEEKNASLREKTNKFDIMKEQKKVTQLQIEQCDDKYSGKTVIDI